MPAWDLRHWHGADVFLVSGRDVQSAGWADGVSAVRILECAGQQFMQIPFCLRVCFDDCPGCELLQIDHNICFAHDAVIGFPLFLTD